jgi:5-methylcytosine-specific restriction endonuclease McrA
VVTRWRYTKGPAWSKSGVLARDGRRCGYCSGPASTVDHILPRSRGGGNTWQNTVSACYACNQAKGDRTPAEAGMVLRIKPLVPSWGSLVQR